MKMPMRKTVVIDVAGLTPALIGKHTPQLLAFAKKGALAPIDPILPAVTCPVQATYLTGTHPDRHGIVGNGWYFRDECEIKFWRQSNKLVQSPPIWERARSLDPSFTCANLFWWFNMYSSVDFAVTPRPMYPTDGRKIPDLYTRPEGLRKSLQAELGRFPLFNFWGPASSIRSSRWIGAAAQRIDRTCHPTLTLIYLPHLDYCLQREGPEAERIAADLREIDAVCGELIEYYRMQAAQVLILSEYGVVPVKRPVHINRVLREAGHLVVRDEMGHELLDAGASTAFAVSDHQTAHVYVNDPDRAAEVRSLLAETAGVSEVLDTNGKRENHLDHSRSGDLVVVSEPDAWFTYYYWLDDRRAPDFACTVDIHRKPGYDPAELFFDPKQIGRAHV